MKHFFSALLLLALVTFSPQDAKPQQLDEIEKSLDRIERTLQHRLDVMQKKVDDLLWYKKIGDVAHIDKVYIYGPPPANIPDPHAKGAANPVKFWTYVFIPHNIDPAKKYPLIVLPHGGVHGDFDTYYTHIVRELIAQQYIVVAAEYRGSTGYGEGHYKQIDYGGLENDDVHASRNYMVKNYAFVDKNRVGIMGWSHGGMITLFNIFEHPEDYKVAFAGVPVSDLVARMGYMTDSYRKLFEADYHIGASAHENVAEYRRRSPVWHAHKLQTPLLIQTNTNDDDVNVLEVEHLIRALKAEGKQFDYEIFQDVPGGHSFDRMDTPHAKQTRLKIYAHLAKYLKPNVQLKTIADINKAAYLPAWE
jgi:dipeptidyl aminopeptidase/acylaminoacyl peptidase